MTLQKEIKNSCQPLAFLNLSNSERSEKEIHFLELEPKYIFPAIPDIKKIILVIKSIIQATIDYHKAEIYNIMFYKASKLFKKPRKPNYKKNCMSIMQRDKSSKLPILNR